jgi:uncharacterized protein YkwD
MTGAHTSFGYVQLPSATSASGSSLTSTSGAVPSTVYLGAPSATTVPAGTASPGLSAAPAPSQPAPASNTLASGATSFGGPTGSSSSSTPAPSATVAAPPSDPHVANALNLINASRATAGLPPLAYDPAMSSCALRHSQDLYGCTGGDMTQSPNCMHKDAINGDTCGASAENQGVATGDEDSAFQQVHQGMMNEGPPPPGQSNHYSNIMSPTFTAVGLGLDVDPNGVLWVSEEFR